MKRILIFASLLFFVFATQSWATETGHPWDGLRESIIKQGLDRPINEIVDVLNSDISKSQKFDEIGKILRPLGAMKAEAILKMLVAVQELGGGFKTDSDCMRCVNKCNRGYCSCLGQCGFFDEECRWQCAMRFVACIIACDCNWVGVQVR